MKHNSPTQPGVQPLSELVPSGHFDPVPKIKYLYSVFMFKLV